MKLNKINKEFIVKAILADLKTDDFISQAETLVQKDAENGLPEILRSHLDYLDVKHVRVRGAFCMSVAVRNNRYSIPKDIETQVLALHDKHVEQRDKLDMVSKEIHALLYSCNTVKQAINTLPENLHKYIPKEEEKPQIQTALVSANLTNLINSIGMKG